MLMVTKKNKAGKSGQGMWMCVFILNRVVSQGFHDEVDFE